MSLGLGEGVTPSPLPKLKAKKKRKKEKRKKEKMTKTKESRRSFTRQPENSKRAHLRVPALQTPPKFHEETPERERGKK